MMMFLNNLSVAKIMSRLCAIAVFFACSACHTVTSDAERMVRDYNEALIVAYRTGNTSKLAEVADEREVRLVRTLIDTKRTAGLALESVLESLAVTGVDTGSRDDMTIETRERWRYHDRSLKRGVMPGNRFVAEMAMRYNWRRIGGKWKVGSVVTLANRTETESSGK